MKHVPTIRRDTTLLRRTARRQRNRQTRCATFAALGASIVAVALASCNGADGGSGTGPVQSQLGEAAGSAAAEVIEDYRLAYNSGDIELVMALFSDDSVVTNHPFATRSAGLAEIRSLQLRDLSVAAPTDAYHLFNFDVSDDSVTWDHEFTDSRGERWCGRGHTAIIATGKIESWAFAPNLQPC